MDLLEYLASRIYSEPRHTGYLHCSTHLTDIDIHNVLDFYKYPRKNLTYADYTRVTTGNLWHEYVHDLTKGVDDAEHEIPVKDGLPEGWNGTADLVICSTLYDFKTTKADKIRFLQYPSAKPLEKYLYQISAYYHALCDMGYWLDSAKILYLPIDGGPMLLKDIDVLPKQRVWKQMEDKKRIVDEFDGVLPEHPGYNYELKTVKSRKVHELFRVPPVYASWCDFIDCDCQRMTRDKVATLTFDDEFDGNKKYESLLRSKL